MARGVLTDHATEPVTLLLKATEYVGPGKEAQHTFTPGETLMANVQPLGAEVAQAMGLQGTTERLRVQLPPLAVAVLARLRYKGRDWAVVKVTPWQSHTVVIVEGVG